MLIMHSQRAVGDGSEWDACNDFDFSQVSPIDVWKNSGAGDFLDHFITVTRGGNACKFSVPTSASNEVPMTHEHGVQQPVSP
jgi:hypothetical protein